MTFQKIIIALMAVTLFACKSNNEKQNLQNGNMENISMPADSIVGKYWILQSFRDQKISNSNNSEQKIGFQLHDKANRVTGFGGCNNFKGIYTSGARNQIHFSQLGSTKMACPDTPFNEAKFLAGLERVGYFTLKNGRLELMDGNELLMAVFKEAGKNGYSAKGNQTNNPEIVEKYWKLKSLAGNEISMEDDQEREIYFTLKTQENRIVGFAGCNNFSGQYSLEGQNKLQVEKMVSTLKACPHLKFDERKFLKLFDKQISYSLKNDVLTLKTEDGTEAVFEAVYFD
ncbi:MAG TPA: META domain-containing protein [Flavobacteriaceae bacterium]|nr:META domain-containing protein [Flavobacteriaceae bacterium]